MYLITQNPDFLDIIVKVLRDARRKVLYSRQVGLPNVNYPTPIVFSLTNAIIAGVRTLHSDYVP